MITHLRAFAAILALGSALLAGCGKGPDAAAPAANAGAASGAAASGAPVAVSTAVAERRDFAVTVRSTGAVAPLSAVDVKAQVASVVNQVHVREGQFVRRGDLLFTLDARTDQANLAKAQAQLARDQATLADAQRQLERSRDLLARHFVAQGAVDTAQANVDAQRAAVQADRAAIDAVNVNLSYARITAPGAGRVGQVTVYPGTSVSSAGPVLATVTQLDPITVAFNLPQRHLPEALQLLAAGTGDVTVTLPDRKGTRQGRLQFVDSSVDATSGTVRVKAGFSNADQLLWPGAYVDVVLPVQRLRGVVVIPQAAIVSGVQGDVAFVVGADQRAQLRRLKILQSGGGDAVVDGVQPGEAVVIDGRQNLRDGSPVMVRAAALRPAGGAVPASTADAAPARPAP